jgi:hypothetical protein
MTETPSPLPSPADGAGQSSTSPTGQQPDGSRLPLPPPPTYGWGGWWPQPPAGYGWGGGWPPARPPRGPLLKPGFAPGPVFIGLIAVVMTLGLLASSDPGNLFLMLSVAIGLTIGFVWLVAFIIGSQDTRLIISRRAWARWALPPVIFFVAVALMVSGIPTTARFELSRSSLDQAVASAQAGNRVGSGWVGLIDVHDARVVSGATFFDTSTPESQERCAFVKFGDLSALNAWLGNTWNPHDYGGGWWYGCTGFNSD